MDTRMHNAPLADAELAQYNGGMDPYPWEQPLEWEFGPGNEKAVPPLLVPCELYEGESLRSYLVRAAAANYYEPLDLLPRVALEGLNLGPESSASAGVAGQDEGTETSDAGAKHGTVGSVGSGGTVWLERAWRPDHPAVFDRLCRLTGTAELELYNASEHRFGGVVTPPGEPVATIRLRSGGGEAALPLLSRRHASRHIRPEHRAQYCPMCLRERPYHRVEWLPAAICICTRHSALLADSCPRCGGQVSTRAVALGRCECGGKLASSPWVDVAADEFGMEAQLIVRSWLLGEDESTSALASLLARRHDILDAPPRALYRIMFGLMVSASLAPPAWPFLHPYPAQARTASKPGCSDAGTAGGIGGDTAAGGPQPIQARATLPRSYDRSSQAARYPCAATAVRALAHWPEGFYEFLDAYAARDVKGRPPGGIERSTLYTDLGALYSTWVEDEWRGEAYATLQTAINAYAAQHYGLVARVRDTDRYRRYPDLARQVTHISLAEAAGLLGVTPETVVRLVDAGRLTGIRRRSGSRTYTFIDDVEAHRLLHRWERSMGLAEAARKLGVTTDVAVGLARLGTLRSERGPLVDGTPRWLFCEVDVSECLLRIFMDVTYVDAWDRAGSGVAGVEMVSPLRAAQMVAGIGGNMASLFRAVAEGELRAYALEMAPGEPVESWLSLGRLAFGLDDVREYMRRITEGNRWLGREETARMIGIKPVVLSSWVRLGVLTPAATHAGAWRFDQEAVERFVREHVWSHQAAEILGVGVSTVQQWARDGRLQPVVGGDEHCHRYLFSRADIERLGSSRRYTATQMAQRLGLSRAQVNRLIKAGVLHPVRGPGIDGLAHYLFSSDDGSE